MSAATVAQGLATNLSAIPETQILACPVSNPQPPTIWIARVNVAFDKAFGSRVSGKTYTDEYTATVQCFAAFTSDAGANAVVYQYLSSSGVYSVKRAVEADQRLGGACDTLWCETGDFIGLSTFQTSSYLLAEWSVTIIATEVAL